MKELTYEFEGTFEPTESIDDLKDQVAALREEIRSKEADLEVHRLKLQVMEKVNLRLAEKAAELQQSLDQLRNYTGVYKVPKPPLKRSDKNYAKHRGEDL